MKRSENIDMTQGNIGRQLISYTLPILMGELFQQFYNTIDTIILGQFVSFHAMAAVGGTSSVTKLLVGFFNGISIGCTVVVSQAFGKKDTEKLRCSAYTIGYMMFFLGVLLSIIGILITKPVLQLLSTPENIMPLALIYVRTYFAGLPGLVMYNTFTGILRAVGDARRPFLFLLFSSFMNVLLDILLVVFFGLGVFGVAVATIAAQSLAAVLCWMLMIVDTDYRRSFFGGKLSGEVMCQVLKIGIPLGFQKTLTSFSNVIVLSYINWFGDACLAGWVIYTKINHFVVVGLQSVGSSITTFVGQNLGCGQYQRAKEGVKCAYWGSMVFTAVLSVFTVLFSEPLTRVFGDDAKSVAYASLFIRYLMLLQLVHVAQSIYAGALRGMGHAVSSTAVLIVSLIGVRQIYLFSITKAVNTPLVVGLSFPLGWMTAGTALYLVYRRQLDRMIEDRDGCCSGKEI